MVSNARSQPVKCSNSIKIEDPFTLYEHYDKSPFIKEEAQLPGRKYFKTKITRLGGGRTIACAILSDGAREILSDLQTAESDDGPKEFYGPLISSKKIDAFMSTQLIKKLSYKRYKNETAIAMLQSGAGWAVMTGASALSSGVAPILLKAGEFAITIATPLISSKIKRKYPTRYISKSVIMELIKTGGLMERRLRLSKKINGKQFLLDSLLYRAKLNDSIRYYPLFEIRYQLLN